DVRPRAGSRPAQRRRFALLRLLACLIGCTFDDLRQRDRERQRWQHFMWASIAAVLLLMGGPGALSWWGHYVREESSCAQTLIWRWGVPEGLGALDAAARSHRAATFHSVTQGGKVRRVRDENSAGVLTENDDGEARWEILYREDGTPERIRVFNEKDQ